MVPQWVAPRTAFISLAMIIGFTNNVRSGLIEWTQQDILDPVNIELVESALQEIGESFTGCKLLELWTKAEAIILGTNYKAIYSCNKEGEKGDCDLRFTKGVLGTLSVDDDPVCIWKKVTKHDDSGSDESVPSEEVRHRPTKKKIIVVETTTFGSDGSGSQETTDCNFVDDEYICE